MSHYSLLILGGTQMLGRDLVQALLDKGHSDFVISNRGLTNPILFENVDHIKIDRNYQDSCSVLQTYTFDTIVDFSCYSLTQYTNITKYLNQYYQYIMISTQSVFDYEYMDFPEKNPEYSKYCINKQRIEHFILTKGDKERTIIVRPCAVYGDNDYTGRFEKRDGVFYWKHTNTVACETSRAINVQEVTKLLLKLIFEPNQTLRSYDIG